MLIPEASLVCRITFKRLLASPTVLATEERQLLLALIRASEATDWARTGVNNAEVAKAREAVQITGERRVIVIPIQADELRLLHHTAARSPESLAEAVAINRNINIGEIFRFVCLTNPLECSTP
jgi:hypothetical protein